MTPNDPLFSISTHFLLMGNIQRIWDDYRGAGIHVGVFDSGVEENHPDLVANYDPSLEPIFNGSPVDPNPDRNDPNDPAHGIAVAGIIAAASNNIGGVGVAFEASITGARISDDDSPIYFNLPGIQGFLSALNQATDFDVVNHSWATEQNFDQSVNLANPSSNHARIEQEWAHLSENGRDGLGTVIVQAAGNSSQLANGSGTNVSRHTITVSATETNGVATGFSNYGASVLITAQGTEVVATDITGSAGINGIPGNNDYTDDREGTSFSAPIITGVVALMLEANPDLGWRDVQNILASSAGQTGSSIGGPVLLNEQPSGWRINQADNWNGGGMSVHESYGYGMVDAYAAVRMAEVWSLFEPARTSANEASTGSGVVNVNQFIPQPNTSTFPFIPGVATGFANINQSIEVEHVAVTATITHPAMTDLVILLTSPDGTTTRLMDAFHNNVSAAQNGLTWTFGVDFLRGEQSAGTWRIDVADGDLLLDGGFLGVFNSFSIEVFGQEIDNKDVYHFTEDFRDLAGLNGARERISDTNGGKDWLNLAAIDADLDVDLTGGVARADGARYLVLDDDSIENIVTGDGADAIDGSARNNKIFGMRGGDSLNGEGGNDEIEGGGGNDTINGGGGNDEARGGKGRDLIKGGAGDDDLFGDDGVDDLRGGAGNDLIKGGSQNDELRGGDGKDTLNGQENDDVLKGEKGADILKGGDGNDFLSGGGSKDKLIDGEGKDSLKGGGSADIFDLFTDSFQDTILDYKDGQDKIALDVGGFGALTFIDQGPGQVKIKYDGDKVVVKDGSAGDLTAADFSASDFIFG